MTPYESLVNAMECERLFHSPQFMMLTEADSEYLIRKLREEARNL